MVGGLLASLIPGVEAWMTLAGGIALALTGLTAWGPLAKKYSRLLIQISIVLLGFWIDLARVLQAGLAGAAFSVGVIVVTFALGGLLAKVLKTESKLAALLSAGTAICGGSAIAATGAVIRAGEAAMSVALGLVFLLNAIALFAFPPLGHALDLSPTQFGAWCAVAVHDVANVVATAKSYGDQALGEATVIKLTRVLWLAPMCLVLGWWFGRGAREGPNPREDHGLNPAAPRPRWHAPARAAKQFFRFVPWFIVGFLTASLVRYSVVRLAPGLATEAAQGGDYARSAAKVLMTAALFLIGTGLSRKAIASVGVRPLLHGVILWLAVSGLALVVIRATVP